MIIIIIIERSRSATITTHSQPPIPRGREKGQKSIRVIVVFFVFFCCCFFFFLPFFQHIKMSKAFTLEKSQKKKKKLFLFMACTPLYFCLWHMRNQFTVHSELQPYLTGPNHSYMRQVKCPLIGDLIVVLYVLCTHLPSFGRAIG